MFLPLLLSVFGIVLILIIFYKTDGIPVYFRLFRINKLFKSLEVDGYFSQLENSPMKAESYLEYLSNKHENFLTHGLACVFCFTTWLSILFTAIIGLWLFFPVIYVCSLLLYFLLSVLIRNA